MGDKLLRSLLIYWCLLLASPVAVLSQTISTTKIEGVSEPPELTGEPKKFEKPSESDRQLFEFIGSLKGGDDAKASMSRLDEFITQHPDYSDP